MLTVESTIKEKANK